MDLIKSVKVLLAMRRRNTRPSRRWTTLCRISNDEICHFKGLDNPSDWNCCQNRFHDLFVVNQSSHQRGIDCAWSLLPGIGLHTRNNGIDSDIIPGVFNGLSFCNAKHFCTIISSSIPHPNNSIARTQIHSTPSL